MIKCEKMPKISFNFILFCAFIAVIVSWHPLSLLHSAHNLIYREESNSTLWTDCKDLQVSSMTFRTWTQKHLGLLLIDRIDTINPIAVVPRTPPIEKKQSGEQRIW